MTSVVNLLVQIADNRNYEIDWAKAYEEINNPTGVPVFYWHVFTNHDAG